MEKFNASNLSSQRLYNKEKNWHDAKIELSEKQKQNFISVFGCRCRYETISSLKKAINDNLRKLAGYGIIQRIKFEENDEVSYCAGQDHPEEISFIRRLVLRHY